MSPLERAVRYYAVGGINTLVGFGLYAGLVRLGLNLYPAQLIAYPISIVFNYFTYSRHVFRGHDRRPIGFVAAYVYNYFQSLALLAAIHHFVGNPYAAGFLAALIGAAISYFVLRRLAFPRPGNPSNVSAM